MGAFLLLFLCSVQGFSSAVQTYSELIYPVPRHKVWNLENPVPQLLPASFQCSKVSFSNGFVRVFFCLSLKQLSYNLRLIISIQSFLNYGVSLRTFSFLL